ncbi:MAG: hypothetical protein HC855_15990 [Rhizobiales bacterium]|nr:hypothetical protein [Hyphomicrobiales bacterium]
MTALLKSLFERKPEMTADDFASLNEQKSALHGRMQQLLRTSQIGTSQRPSTDRFGRPLH